MDERQLKDVLGCEDTPPADDNARKRAINLALAAFDDAQQDKRINHQGFRYLDRLTGRTNPPTGRRPMTRQFVFGRMATATAAVLDVVILAIFRCCTNRRVRAKNKVIKIRGTIHTDNVIWLINIKK